MSGRELRVGLIGFGSIGRAVASAIVDGRAGSACLVGVLRRSLMDHELGDRVPIVPTIDALLAQGPSLVIECAGREALHAYGAAVLQGGADLMPLSVGAFGDSTLVASLEQAARASGRRIRIPSGGIAGLDALSAAGVGELDEVTHTIRKHPRAFRVDQLVGRDTSKACVLYDGPVRAGVASFPENANVAAAVSLAGLGLDHTTLRVIADPSAERNSHEVVASGRFGRLRIVVENVPGPNPKTSRIVPLSVVSALRRMTGAVIVGA